MYKKLLALALACVAALAIAGCGSSASSSAASSAASSSAASSAAASSAASSAAASSEASSAASASASSASADADIAGTYSGNTYTNKLFGFKFDLPSDMKFASQQELAQKSGVMGDTIQDKDIVAALEAGNAFFVLSAETSDKLANINGIVESTDPAQLEATSIEDILTTNADLAVKELKNQGISDDIKSELSTTEFCGEKVPSIRLNYEIKGVPVYQDLIMLKGDDGYLMSITVTSANTDRTDEVFGDFSAL